MDKYLIKKPKETKQDSSKKGCRKQMKQSTIESLQGVVVVEEIRRLKSKLQLESTSKEEMVDSLNKLGQKIPPRHVMLDTKIGKLVNKLRKHEDSDIRKAARRVYVKWKEHFVSHAERPVIEVMCDTKTDKMRTSGKKLLAGSLELEESHNLPDAIEREAFYHHKRLINYDYRRTMRTLVFTLKNNEDIRKKVITGELKVPEFVQTYKKC
ncbi:transcription elongation factor A N-terminal and central domain-containing protein 2-like [Mytilus galloprovincialis]|uniref:transcription elongation factor A N-terminal and central domain-containing protein 2-like n=1 Tax=Mytilus galloprovincialis TaxID=29158 RepID=UPI003F7BCBDB